MSQQPTSLLSLPDELLVQIFDHLAVAVRLWYRDHPLLPLKSICRRLRQVVATVLYRDVTLGPGSHFEAAVKQNPSLGQLVSSLRMYDDIDFSFFRAGVLDFQTQSALQTLTKLKELIVWDVTTDAAASILATLPSPPLRHLDLHLDWTTEPTNWQDLQIQLSRFHELCHLHVVAAGPSPRLAHAPGAPPRSTRRLSLPQIIELHVADNILVEGFGAAGPLRETLPNLRKLHLDMSLPENSSAVSATLADLPSSLATLKLLHNQSSASPVRYFPALPAIRGLEFGNDSFTEADLLAYLPTATGSLESIGFALSREVTDRVLQTLTGPERPLRLRHLRLNHMMAWSPDQIREHVERYHWEGKDAEEVRRQLHPRWPDGATLEGLRLALANAHANGIQVTGSALDCLDWDATFDKVFAEYGKK